MTDDEFKSYLEERFESWRLYYRARGNRCKNIYFITQTIVVSGTALTPLAVALTESKTIPVPLYAPIIISSIVAIASGIQALLRPQEGWIRHRTANIALVNLHHRFNAKVRPFDSVDLGYRREVFADRVEQIIDAENNAWAEALSAATEKGK